MLLGWALYREGAGESLVKPIEVFERVLAGTDDDPVKGEADPRSARAGAAAGLADAGIVLAREDLADARRAMNRNDWRRLQNEHSSFLKAVASAERGLAVSKECGDPGVARQLQGELDSVVGAWKREVEPVLRRLK